MVLHSRGCGRVARRRFTCWASRSSLWLPGGPIFVCPAGVWFSSVLVPFLFQSPVPCHVSPCFPSVVRFPCGVPGRNPAGFQEEDSFPVCSAWSATVPVCPYLPFAGCSVPGKRDSPIRPAGVPSPLIPMSPESFAESPSGSPCFVHCFTDRIVELDYTGSETIQNELVSLIGLCIGGYHHVRWIS